MWMVILLVCLEVWALWEAQTSDQSYFHRGRCGGICP
jgi:hypothetical protein